ncbi:MAG: glycosyltransferase [Herbaspirillum sp.]
MTQQTLNLCVEKTDQDALNIVLEGKVRYLSPRWNYMHNLAHDLSVNRFTLRPVGKVVFIHFVGAVKPWADWSGHDARYLFRKYLAASPWTDMPLDPEPQNSKQMRLLARSLYRRFKIVKALKWFFYYLRARS